MDKISQNGGKNGQYYPTKSDGKVDEWEAISRQQQELIKKENQSSLNKNNEQK